MLPRSRRRFISLSEMGSTVRKQEEYLCLTVFIYVREKLIMKESRRVCSFGKPRVRI